MAMLFPDDDDDISSLIREYNSMDPAQRSDFLEAHGLTREGWRSRVAAHERRRRAAREARSSTDAPHAGRDGSGFSSDGEVVVVTVRLPRPIRRVDILLDAVEGGVEERSLRHRSAPPASGRGATGPGRRRSGSRRPSGSRGRPGTRLLVIVLSEE
ncbi:hypothetical protein [Streptomyces sp. NPDC021224]|uniref:hypothetical protein n=1 Tax=unclassified Streptomyces TaxID=2593676 RepID=UPI0037AB7D45